MFSIVAISWALAAGGTFVPSDDGDHLPGTVAWVDRGDPAEAMVQGIHRFYDRALAENVERRAGRWRRDTSSTEAYLASVSPQRGRLRSVIGTNWDDERSARVALTVVAPLGGPPAVAESPAVDAFEVRWTVEPGIEGEGLLLRPRGEVVAGVLVMADCDVDPEAFVGIDGGPSEGPSLPLRLAQAGCFVLVPTLVDRDNTFSGSPLVRVTNLTHREWAHRMTYESGRHLIGYEVDRARAGVAWLRQTLSGKPVGVVGHGEGGMIAFYAAATDDTIQAAWIAGHFGPRERVWGEPLDRNVWRLLVEFGDAEVATLIAPRGLVIEACRGPEVPGPPPARDGRSDAAPGSLTTRDVGEVRAEFDRIPDGLPGARPELVVTRDGRAPWNSDGKGLASFLRKLGHVPRDDAPRSALRRLRPSTGREARIQRQLGQIVDHAQGRLRTSEVRRAREWEGLDTSSPAAWQIASGPLRERLWNDVIGRLPDPTEPLRAESIKLFDEPNWVGYGVRLPVWPDVEASGILLLPRDLKPGERRPVVVCQHGLEGRPEDVVNPRVESVYRSFGATLADRGFIVYAPQNPYIGQDAFRQIVRKANPLGTSLFSVILGQHQRTLEWLATLPGVDPERIAFYGLSYGGKTAMRVPSVLEGYALSICSADFNEWVMKCTNLDRSFSYMYTIEYDMYEFGLAESFNYAEMAALIAPRPFLVERGHDDGVAPDEWVAYEYAKVKRFYDRLGVGDRTVLAIFNGGHRIDGTESFPFLARHLNWPRGSSPPLP